MSIKKHVTLVQKPLVPSWDRYGCKTADGKYSVDEDGLSYYKKSNYVPWKHGELMSVLKQMTTFRIVPIKCTGKDCPFAADCPLVAAGGEHLERALGNNCPIELFDAFWYFIGYIIDLGLKPTDFTDLQMVNDLVRLQLQINRCDRFLQREDPFEVVVIGTDSKTSLTHKSRAPHALVQQQRLLRESMDKLYQRLVASREARNNEASRSGKRQDMLSQMAQALAEARQKRQDQEQELNEYPRICEGDDNEQLKKAYTG